MTVYQVTANNEKMAKFVSVSNKGDVTESSFSTKTTQVAIAGGKVGVVTNSLTLFRPKDVSCETTPCLQAQLVGNSVKISFTGVKGDTAAITAMLDEAMRLLGLWRANYKADQGMLPPVVATFPTA